MNCRALELPVEKDLRPFLDYLGSQGVKFRVSEECGLQIVWVANHQEVAAIANAYRAWESGAPFLLDQIQPFNSSTTSSRYPSISTFFMRVPITVGTLIICVLVFLLTMTGLTGEWLLAKMLFQPVEYRDTGFVLHSFDEALGRGEYWRIITPVFLHFSILHLAFNMLWLWYLGLRLESMKGHLNLLMVILLTGVAGNVGQYLINLQGENVPFGGMSGVLYGLLGYIACWNLMCEKLARGSMIPLDKGITTFMFVWLLVCMTGFTEWVGLGAVANAAHVFGLIAGSFLGLAQSLIKR